ncbi:hypothetical protein [uncultured Nostoc sp.]
MTRFRKTSLYLDHSVILDFNAGLEVNHKMRADDRIIFRINSTEKEAFMAKVQKENKKPSEVLISLVRRYLEEEEQSQTLDLEQIKLRLQEHENKLEILENKLLGESAA